MSRFATPRIAIMLVFSAFGALVGIWAGSIPHVTAQAGISNSQLGFALAISTLASVLAMGLGGVISRWVSNRTALLLLVPLFAAFTIGMMASRSPVMFIGFAVLQAVVLGLTDIFMNAEASSIEHRVRRPIFTAFHGTAALHMAIFAILSSFVTAAMGPLASCVPAVLLALMAWVAVLLFVDTDAPVLTMPKAEPIRRLWRHVPLLLLGLATGLSIAAEGAAVFWSAKLIEQQAPDLARIYGIGVAFFGVCEATVRFVGDRLRARLGEINLLLASFAISAVSFAVLGLAPPLGISAAAFALAGIGLACISPCTFALAARESPNNRPAALAVVSLVAGLPRTMAPLLFGWVAGSGGMVAVFGIAAFIPLAGIAIVLWLRTHARAQNSSQRGVRAA